MAEVHHLTAVSLTVEAQETRREKEEWRALRSRQSCRARGADEIRACACQMGYSTMAEAAAKLGCSARTLKGHIEFRRAEGREHRPRQRAPALAHRPR